MTLELKQTSKYEGKDYWRWSVWVDGPEQELNQIEYVEYTLHPTFPQPVRTIANRSSKFRLDAVGWGVFTIYVMIVHIDGGKTLMEHYLELTYPDGTSTTA